MASPSANITIRTRRASMDVPAGGEATPRSTGAEGSAPGGSLGWPRTWAASSDWSARVGASSLAESLRRTTYAAGPVTEAQIEAEAAAAEQQPGQQPSPSPPPAARAAARSRLRQASGFGNGGDLEEALLYDFDETLEEAAGAEAAADAEGAAPAAADDEDGDDEGPAARRPSRQASDRSLPLGISAAAAAWRARGEGGGSASFKVASPSAAADGEWEATPLLPARGTPGSFGSGSFSGSLPKHEHSYLLTRRREGGGGGGSFGGGGAAAGADAAAGYSEPFVVHVEQEGPTSSTLQTAFNAVNLLCGVGLLTVPYALDASGWAALLLLALVGAIACTTGAMLAACMSRAPGIRSYPDIGGAALGAPGRILVSVLLYLELFACCVDFLILEGDGLGALFPGASISIGGLTLSAKQTMMLVAAGLLLPSVLMRDLSLLSYLSVFGIFASLLLIALVGSTAAATGFPNAALLPGVTWRGLPTSAALFSFCFSGHAVFPSLYASLRAKRQFGRVLLSSFTLVCLLYGGMAVLGACMFPSVSDNVVLDVQKAAPHAPVTHVAMWTVVINPLSKVALTLTPVAMAVEELMPFKTNSRPFALASAAVRTGLLAAVLLVALCCPFFSIVMSLIGAVFSMSISICLPCLFYYKLCQPGARGVAVCIAIAAFGAAAGATATADAVRNLMSQY